MTDAPSTAPLLRLAHFSDIHLTARAPRWQWRDLMTKRVTGWLNVNFGRGQRFRDAEKIASNTMTDIRKQGCHHIVFSGDATTLGFDEEFELAAHCLGLDRDDAMPGIAVPGNHDYYTAEVGRAGLFESTFAKWQIGQRFDAETYPFAQRAGHCWLIGVNTARANALPWDARGEMGQSQARRLRELLRQLTAGPRILVTHYPLFLANGEFEHRWRRSRDDEELQKIALDGGVCLWLHGHRHSSYVLRPSGRSSFPVICSGSATQRDRWSWNEYEIRGQRLHMIRRAWRPPQNDFAEVEALELDLPA